MEAKLIFVDHLLKLERRIFRIYEKWSASQALPAELRALWKEMAEDEKQHIAILEHSAGRLNFAPTPPLDARLAQIEEIIAAAERVSERPEITTEETLRHALALESSELNSLDNHWVEGFHANLGSDAETWRASQTQHTHRLAGAVQKFAGDENLRRQAAELWSGDRA